MRVTHGMVCLAAAAVAFAMAPVPQAAPAGPIAVVAARSGVQGRGAGVIFEPATPRVEIKDSGTAAVSGTVIDADTRRPVAGAIVALSGGVDPIATNQRPRQVTDSSGRFVFTQLAAPTRYGLSVRHPDYQNGSMAQFALADGEWFSDAQIALTPNLPASISGQVLDERGDPVAGVPVVLYSHLVIGGHTHPVRRWRTDTDDRGMYRASGLQPGDYIVHVPSVQITVRDGSIRPPAGAQRPLALDQAGEGVSAIIGHFPTGVTTSGRAYSMAYHPAARTHTDASTITLARGDQRAGIDVRLSLVPTFRVSGTLTGPADAIANMPVWLTHAGNESSGQGAEVAMTLSGPTGQFTLLNVPAGDYTLLASRTQVEFTAGGGPAGGFAGVFPERGYAFNMSLLGTTMNWAGGALAMRGRDGAPGYARQSLAVVDRDVRDLVVSITPGVTVSGYYTWDGETTAPRNGTLPRIDLEPTGDDMTVGLRQSALLTTSVTAGQGATFALTGVPPGRYTIGSPPLGGGDVIVGVESRGRTLIGTPLDVGTVDITDVVVRLSATQTIVTGAVRDSRGTAASSGTVLIFPVSPAAWETPGLSAPLFKTVPVSAGAYRSPHLLPGEYFIVAVPEADRAWLADRRLLTLLSNTAVKIRAGAGATITQDLAIAGGDR